MVTKRKAYAIDGAVLHTKSHADWLDDFLDWLESRGESFAGISSRGEYLHVIRPTRPERERPERAK